MITLMITLMNADQKKFPPTVLLTVLDKFGQEAGWYYSLK
jgi:hypothetical protein